jgi:alpha-1,3-rhamnosyl/mannosyltransferase
MQKELRRTIDVADALITDSDYTRQELCNYFGFSLDRIYTVPLAASDEFRPRTEEECSSVLHTYSLKYHGYSLYVGTVEPRKNLESLLAAYANLPNHIRQCFPLVISGYRGWKSEKIHQQINTAVSQGWAIYLGFVPSCHLPFLYSAASLFIFPSHYEGFGLPVLEAMSSGTPVVCSNASSIPEVVGDAALMSDPLDVELLAENIQKALEDVHYRSFAIEGGLVRSSQFTWDLCANRTIDVYQSVAGNRR